MAFMARVGRSRFNGGVTTTGSDLMSRTTDAEFTLEDSLKRESLSVEIFNGHYLNYQRRRFRRTISYSVDLATLSPEVGWEEDICWHWVLASAIMFVPGIGFLIRLLGELNVRTFAELGLAVFVFLLLGSLALLMFYIKSHRKFVIRTRYAEFPLIEIQYLRHRDGERLKAFVELLQARIRATVAERGLSEGELKAGEVRMLRRMARKQVISDYYYESAKSHIFSHKF